MPVRQPGPNVKGKVLEKTLRAKMCEPWTDPFRETFFGGDEPCRSYTAAAQGAIMRRRCGQVSVGLDRVAMRVL